ncbi:integrase core domain-containing protein [Achromobacter insolitus]|uniref:integrase core domain-containing protein n=1 Tax=Achromobacter insolitus TaxID=217204 RepID=UPI001F33253F|nr:transposase [Achromobacter insolitus]
MTHKDRLPSVLTTSRPVIPYLNDGQLVERFNRTYRTEVLEAHLFTNLEKVQAITDQWLVDYNQYRPHESLGGLRPVQFMPRLTLAPIVYQPMST